MQKRTLGKTGAELSVIGFGGIVVTNVSPAEADRYVGEAIDRGINYFDVAPQYGNAEERLGPALKPYRDEVFLACKTEKRDAAGARSALENSLKLLKTDYFDLYQFHGVPSVEDAEQILAPGGALETALKAQKEGLIRHIGFSAHSQEAALLLLNSFDFTSVLFPVNFRCWIDGGFGPKLIQKAREKEVGILALKALANRPLEEGEQKKWTKCWYVPIDTLDEAIPALGFTLSLPVTAAVAPGHIELLRLACDALDALGEPPWDTAPSTDDSKPIFSAE
ncbi:aldo/keto reductase [Tichowtungia aerotolerans]|uniref:Aldo/keto reductase n=1 Tax=Tichowtungia aerotolerans TaxID=2697043 RepID=A0A6P1M230_9BACT|nr:aldo/keto reductase [Tichowtungia aerotolerans]QHI67901.1 aldo/keto reductase [Tichowtungia aerotolerans]